MKPLLPVTLQPSRRHLYLFPNSIKRCQAFLRCRSPRLPPPLSRPIQRSLLSLLSHNNKASPGHMFGHCRFSCLGFFYGTLCTYAPYYWFTPLLLEVYFPVRYHLRCGASLISLISFSLTPLLAHFLVRHT